MLERARVVIGADGRNSHVAKAVQPEQYNEKPMLQWSYYTYWSDLPVDGFEIVIRPDRGWAAVPTNDGLTMLVVGWPYAESTAYKADVEANYLKTLELAPEFADRVRGATARGAVRRRRPSPTSSASRSAPAGRSSATPATTRTRSPRRGSRDAFRDAELCSTALDETFSGERAFDDAMSALPARRATHACCRSTSSRRSWRRSKPPPPEMQQLLGAVHGNHEAMDAFVSITAGTVSPVEFFDPENIGRIMGAVQV